MKDEIKLPPLPSHPELINPDGYQPTRYTQIPALYDWAESYARAAIEADRQMRGEPSGAKWYTQSRKGLVQGPCEDEAQATKFALMRSEAFPDYGPYIAICLAPVFAKPTAPQPATPAQEPSDDDLHNLWSRSGGVMRTFARALLARYGAAQPSVPDGWKLVPVEPDYIMKAAARNAPIPAVLLDSISARADLENTTRYKSMLAAAPKFGEDE